MSITYPEAQPSAASIRAAKPASANVMNAGSALFPSGATKVYERAAKARNGGGVSLAWIAAPVAVVLIGGAVYLSTSHHPTAANQSPSARVIAPVAPPQTLSSTSTSTTTSPAAVKVAPVAPIPAPVVAERHIVTQSRTTEAPAARPATHVARSSTTRTQSAPVAQPAQAPVMATPDQAVTPVATPGTFAYTPAPASAASDSAQPMSQSAAPSTTDTGLAPSAPTSTAPSGDQASPQ